MLATLRVRNFVLIDQLELQLGPGLNVLTGETGAGKSIMVDALALILGGRASPDIVRTGESEAEVEAQFDIEPGGPIAARLADSGVPHTGELIIRRTVSQAGRSRAYLNGRLCTVGELAALGPLLMDIASQHESVALTDPSTHIGYLDAFARLATQRAMFGAEFDALREVVANLRREVEATRTRAEREAFLRFQLSALDEADPRAGEEEELQAERGRLRNADKIGAVAQRAAARLERDEGAMGDELGRIIADLCAIEAYEPQVTQIIASLETARSELVEAGWAVGRLADRVEADPARLSEVEERLFLLEKLRRKHGPTLADVIAARERLRGELSSLESSEARLSSLEADRQRLLETAGQLATELSRKRAEAAAALSASITRELSALGMGSARVVVDVAPLDAGEDDGAIAFRGARLSRDGIDRVEFLIAPNKGSEPRPLRKVASGGELSRSLLALKRVLADVAPAGTYVFDEVDTGVGGAVAEAIGRAMADVAAHRQVICVTHLAQIAAFGTSHFVVEKSALGELTRSTITEVKSKARVQELARMMSGSVVTESARKAAVEMLRAADATTKARKTPQPPQATSNRDA